MWLKFTLLQQGKTPSLLDTKDFALIDVINLRVQESEKVWNMAFASVKWSLFCNHE